MASCRPVLAPNSTTKLAGWQHKPRAVKVPRNSLNCLFIQSSYSPDFSLHFISNEELTRLKKMIDSRKTVFKTYHKQ